MGYCLYSLFWIFRLGELLPVLSSSFKMATDLSWGDVAVDNHASPRMVQIHLKTSKCDQYGQGADVIVVWISVQSQQCHNI